MDANEIVKLAPDTLLPMRVGDNPLIVRKLRYFADKEFAGMFDVVWRYSAVHAFNFGYCRAAHLPHMGCYVRSDARGA